MCLPTWHKIFGNMANTRTETLIPTCWKSRLNEAVEILKINEFLIVKTIKVHRETDI